MNNKRPIFENVTFLNEGLGTVLLIAIGGICATAVVSNVVCNLIEKKECSTVRKALHQASKTNQDILRISERITTVKEISRSNFMDMYEIDEKDKYAFAQADISIFAAFENNKILACTIYDHAAKKCKYLVSDKSIKGDVLKYVYARLELCMNYFGDNIKYFVNEDKIRRANYHKISAKERSTPDITILSKEVQKAIYRDLDNVCRDSISFLKSKCKEYTVTVEYNKDYKKGENDNDEYCYILITDPKEEEYFENDNIDEWIEKYQDKFYHTTKLAVSQLMEKLKISESKKNNKYRGSEDNHPYICIGDYSNPDDFANQAVCIGTVFDDVRGGIF